MFYDRAKAVNESGSIASKNEGGRKDPLSIVDSVATNEAQLTHRSHFQIKQHAVWSSWQICFTNLNMSEI